MTHPITPPPKLLQQWVNDATFVDAPPGTCPSASQIAIQAARWGADQELEACCEWLGDDDDRDTLRAVRRPAPPTPRQRALAACATALSAGRLTPDEAALIRVALEAQS